MGPRLVDRAHLGHEGRTSLTAVWRRVVAERRRRWRSWLALSLLVGLGAGVVLSALVGARRTETAYPRFVTRHHAADVLVPGENPSGLVGGVDLDKVERLTE